MPGNDPTNRNWDWDWDHAIPAALIAAAEAPFSSSPPPSARTSCIKETDLALPATTTTTPAMMNSAESTETAMINSATIAPAHRAAAITIDEALAANMERLCMSVDKIKELEAQIATANWPEGHREWEKMGRKLEGQKTCRDSVGAQRGKLLSKWARLERASRQTAEQEVFGEENGRLVGEVEDRLGGDGLGDMELNEEVNEENAEETEDSEEYEDDEDEIEIITWRPTRTLAEIKEDIAKT